MPGFASPARRIEDLICQHRVGSQQRQESPGDVRKVKLEAAGRIAEARERRGGIDPRA